MMQKVLAFDRVNEQILHEYTKQSAGITDRDLDPRDYRYCAATSCYIITRGSRTDVICQLKMPGYNHLY